jgi:hypothetical protein
MKLASLFVFALALSTTHAFAAKKVIDLNCSDNSGTNSGYGLTIDLEKGTLTSGDGGEMGGVYKADPSKDTAGYAAYKIRPSSQDGEQPEEIKVSKSLLDGSAKKAPVWLAPGIVGGPGVCKVQE